MTGTKKMPPPMTLEMTIAAASNGPSRRASVAASGDAAGALATASLHGRPDFTMRNDPVIQLHAAEGIDAAAAAREDLRRDVLEQAMGEQVGAGFFERDSRRSPRTVTGSVVPFAGIVSSPMR